MLFHAIEARPGSGVACSTWPALLLAASVVLGVGCSDEVQTAPPTPSTAAEVDMTAAGPVTDGRPFVYVGGAACERCHEQAYAAWTGSHHDLAMQVADEATVLGDFDNARFTYAGVGTTFFRRDGRFVVNTDGPDGRLQDYEITHAFGVYPLQQYLVAFPGGRYQALSICWDARPAEAGGQRWFHLYPDERIIHDDELHWTGPNQNWNFMCAECHSTNLQKRYDLDANAYQTTWSDIDVSCEACHGPGSRHVAWAEEQERLGEAGAAEAEEGHGDEDEDGDEEEDEDEDEEDEEDLAVDELAVGLPFRLKEPTDGQWLLDNDLINYWRQPRLTSDIQLETCARCHARRHVVDEDYVHGRRLHDTHQPVVLEAPLYHADGQILDEVYVYGSFVQSRMYHKGVRCTDCHDPHRLTVYEEGNGLCGGCHLSDRFDTPDHHFHESGTEGASCVACHMPVRHYMVVDPRLDHSIRVPRPDLSVALGLPNACNGCHDDKDAAWSAEAVARWYGPTRRRERHYGAVLHAGRRDPGGAAADLAALAGDIEQPAIARATALALLARRPGATAFAAAAALLRDDSPAVRISALSVLEPLPPPRRLPLVGPLLDDPVRAVRAEAGRMLASVPTAQMNRTQRQGFERAFEAYVAVQRANAERAWSHLNLGNIYLARGWLRRAEAAYRMAIRVNERAVPPYVNLADLYRHLGREQQCEDLLRQALERAPGSAQLHHALGLALVRQKRIDEALASLAEASRLEPDDVRLAYVYAVALNSSQQPDEAMKVLEAAHLRHPNDRSVLFGLATFNRDRGRGVEAIMYARRLVEIYPHDHEARGLLRALKGGRGE